MCILSVRRFAHASSFRAFLTLIALLSLLVTTLAGCAWFTSQSSPAPLGRFLRIPIIAYGHDIHTMDPARVQDYVAYMPVALVFPGLLALDAHGNPVPWAATDMPTFDYADNTYTFQVRSGLKWSDGTPIDASTFAYSINRSLSPCTGSAVTYYLFPIKDAQAFSMENCTPDGRIVAGKISSLIGDSLLVPDPQTLVIQLTAPALYFLQALTYPTTYAQPKQLIEQYGEKDWTNHLTDNGGFGGNLFKVKTWDHAGNLDLIRNSAFWGTKPQTHEVDFQIYTTANVEYSDYQIGKLDIGIPPLSYYAEAKHRRDFHELPYLAISYLQPNWQLAPFNDVRARQAFALAINKEALATSILSGSAIATNHIVPDGMYGYDSALVGPDGTANLTGNIALAQQLMQQYAHDACGGKLSNCPPVVLCGSGDPMAQAIDQAIVQSWRQTFPGYTVFFSYSCRGDILPEVYYLNNLPLFDTSWVADYPDPQDWLSLQFGVNALNNVGNVNVTAANTLMTAADASPDSDTRAALYNMAEQMLVSQVAWIPLYQQQFYYNQPTYVHNITFTNLGLIPLSSWQQITISSH